MEQIQYLDGPVHYSSISALFVCLGVFTRTDMPALPGRTEEDGIAVLQAGTAIASYSTTRLIMMAIACFQVLISS
jgi:hypothetical protein